MPASYVRYPPDVLNLLTAQQASFEDSGAPLGVTAVGQCTLSSVVSEFGSTDGTRALKVTFSGPTGPHGVITDTFAPVVGNRPYTGMGFVQLPGGWASSEGTSEAKLIFYNASNVEVGSATGAGNLYEVDWEPVVVQATAPATAVKAKLQVTVVSGNPAVGRYFEMDRLGIMDGTYAYTDWAVPQPHLIGGKKLRTRQRVIGADTIQEQFIAIAAEKTYYVRTGAILTAQNRLFMAFLNNAGSGQVLKVRRLFIQNCQLTAITSGTAPATVGGIEFEVRKITSITGGTSLTANPADSVDGALANYNARSAPTSVTEGASLYSWYTNNDEIGLTGAFSQYQFQALTSSLIDGWELRELTLQPGEGFCVKQITNISGRGQFDVLAVISKED